jgi:dihydrofolate synthase/folylpolyglutamate synthase
LGQHQLANAATALAALDALAARTGLIAPVQARRDGLREARWPGRFEVLGRQPCVVVDSAHNGDSASKLRAALETWFPHRETTLVFGASGDHPYADSLRELLPVAGSLILTASRHERATPPDTLAKVAREAGREGLICPAVPEALSAALQAAGDDGLICVTGSVFVVAEARLAWLELNGLPLPPVDPAL